MNPNVSGTTYGTDRRRHMVVLAVSFAVLAGIAPAHAATCGGDCNDDGTVSAAELVRAMQIFAGDTAVGTCSSADANDDEVVTEDELDKVIHHLFDACASESPAASESELCFAGLVGAPIAPQTVVVERSEGSWTAQPGASWLTVTPSSGQAGARLEVRVDASGLTDGSYEATVIISDEALQTAVSIRVGLSLYMPSATAGWKVQTIEPVGTAVNGTSLALDPEGRPGITFYRADRTVDRQLRYAHWTGCRWRAESVERLGIDSSLAFDRIGRPHISFLGAPDVLRYGRKKGPNWYIVTVEDQGDGGSTGSRSSLALDATDHPHISYLLKRTTGHIFTYDLRYVHFDGKDWTFETVDAEGTTGWDTSLALSPGGDPRISYHTDLPEVVRYAEWLGDHWNLETVDQGGRPSSLRLDSAGRPRIANHGTAPRDPQLRFAYRDEDHWHTERVDSQGVSPLGGSRAGVSLALDSGDLPHIAYVDFVTGALQYASQSATGAWQIEVIDTGPNVGDYCSLQIDRQDVAHISYLDQTTGTLKYAQGPARD